MKFTSFVFLAILFFFSLLRVHETREPPPPDPSSSIHDPWENTKNFLCAFQDYASDKNPLKRVIEKLTNNDLSENCMTGSLADIMKKCNPSARNFFSGLCDIGEEENSQHTYGQTAKNPQNTTEQNSKSFVDPVVCMHDALFPESNDTNHKSMMKAVTSALGTLKKNCTSSPTDTDN